VDGWFIGITPSLVVGTWVGGEDPWIRFNTLADGQGSRMAKPFFKAFLNRLEASTDVDYDPSARFERPPPSPDDIETDCSKYYADRGGTSDQQYHGTETFEEEFIENE
jgi:penicillin-binding protein 1A